MISAVLRPLDILAHELATNESNNSNLEKYMIVLKDMRKLLLHVPSVMNNSCNNITLRAFSSDYPLKTDNGFYTLPFSEFQSVLLEQNTEKKNMREATSGFCRRNQRLSSFTANSNQFFSARSVLSAGQFPQQQFLQHNQQQPTSQQ